MKKDILDRYGGKTRIRVCGICITDESILLVNHKGLSKNSFWAPPGGGIDYLEDANSALKREFLEETHAEIEIGKFLFVNEFVKKPLHAIELFFEVNLLTKNVRRGFDPEHNSNEQIITEVKFVTFDELSVISREEKHNILHNVNSKESLLNMRGYFHFSR